MQFDNGWWGFILGAPYFNSEYGSLVTTDPLTGATSKSLSASEQSAGTGLGTAGIMLGIMVSSNQDLKSASNADECHVVRTLVQRK